MITVRNDFINYLEKQIQRSFDAHNMSKCGPRYLETTKNIHAKSGDYVNELCKRLYQGGVVVCPVYKGDEILDEGVERLFVFDRDEVKEVKKQNPDKTMFELAKEIAQKETGKNWMVNF